MEQLKLATWCWLKVRQLKYIVLLRVLVLPVCDSILILILRRLYAMTIAQDTAMGAECGRLHVVYIEDSASDGQLV